LYLFNQGQTTAAPGIFLPAKSLISALSTGSNRPPNAYNDGL
jgi:hypothetical protein